MKRSRPSAIGIADRTLTTKRKREYVSDYGNNYLFRHSLLPSFTRRQLPFIGLLTSVGKGLTYANLCRLPSNPSLITTVDLYSAKAFGQCLPVMLCLLQFVQQP